MDKVYAKLKAQLVEQVRGRDLVRLQCLDHKFVGAWLTAIPSPALALELSAPLFRALLRFWLGQPIVISAPVSCPFCKKAADAYGDHFLCCDEMEFHKRHRDVVSVIAHVARASGLQVDTEVGKFGSREEGAMNRLRPGDVYIPHFFGGEAAIVDPSITHPLAPSLGLSATGARDALKIRAERKHHHYAPVRQNQTGTFVPFIMSTFGALDEVEAVPFLGQLRQLQQWMQRRWAAKPATQTPEQ